MEKEKEVKLSVPETRALEGWRRDSSAQPVPNGVAAQMLQLFLRGYSCHDIRDQEAFRGYTAGAVVHARVSGRWDEARDEHWERVRRSTIDQAVRVGEETTRTIFDLLSCANLDLSKKARAYLAGTSSAMPVEVDKVVHFKQLVDLFLTSTKPLQDGGSEQPKDDEELQDLSGLTREQQLALLAGKARQLGIPKHQDKNAEA